MAAQSNNPVVNLTDVFKIYKVGEVDVPAVKAVMFTIPRRRFPVIAQVSRGFSNRDSRAGSGRPEAGERGRSSQQDVGAFDIAIIVLAARSNRLDDLRALVPRRLEIPADGKTPYGDGS